MMRHWFGGLVLGLFVVATASADVTVKATSTGKGFAQLADGETVSYIKGRKMRADMVRGDTKTSMILDIDSQKMISIDHKKKEAEITDLAQLQETLKKVTDADIKVSVKPTGQTRQILGQECQEHLMEVRVAFAPIPDQKVEMVMGGPAWIAKDSPGKADYLEFYKAAAEKGMLFGVDPRAAKAQAGQIRGMAALYEAMANAGIPYVQEIQIKFEGGGMMAAMMSKMGGTSMTNTINSIATDTLDDALFAVPAGYKTKTR